MNDLVINKTKNTPSVKFDGASGICEISGDAFPSNSSKFWHPVFKWLNEFASNGNNEITFKFRLSGLNTGSAKAIFSIMGKLENYRQQGMKTRTYWYYNENDSYFREIWKDLTEDTKIPNFLVSCENMFEDEDNSISKISNTFGSIDKFILR